MNKPLNKPFLETAIPPPIVAMVFACLMWTVSLIVPPMPLPEVLRRELAFVFMALGLGLDCLCVMMFVRSKTTVNPLKPNHSSVFVCRGVYRFSRNPMYLGLFIVLLGWGIFLSNVVGLLIAILFIPYINRFQIKPEEQALSAIFGDTYENYKKQVRRWL